MGRVPKAESQDEAWVWAVEDRWQGRRRTCRGRDSQSRGVAARRAGPPCCRGRALARHVRPPGVM